ncbi:hypothetical protein ACHAQH_001857 [Verticillium albo-atrum]
MSGYLDQFQYPPPPFTNTSGDEGQNQTPAPPDTQQSPPIDIDPATVPPNPRGKLKLHRTQGKGNTKTGRGKLKQGEAATVTKDTEGRPLGQPAPHAYPPCDACVARSKSCSQYRPCANCHTEGEKCADSRALHALGNLDQPGKKRKLGGLTDGEGRPFKRVRLEPFEGPCKSCAASGTQCDADHDLRIGCTACADARAIRDPDHDCAVADTTYRVKRSQWTRAPYDAIPQVVHWSCEGCKNKSNRRCDVDPRVEVGCSECAVRGIECRFVPDKREPWVVKSQGRRPLKVEFERDPGPAWWRRRCGMCAARGISCSWLSDYRNIGLKCQNCIDEQTRLKEFIPDAVVECFDAEDGYKLCDREMGDMRDDGSVVLPTKMVTRKQSCSVCRRGGSNHRCRGYEGMDHLACVRCTAWGLPCFDRADEPGHPSGDPEHSGEYPEPKDYGDLQLIGWGSGSGSGSRAMMEYHVCKPCQTGDYNCDRQRPCDKCVEHGTVNDCTLVSSKKDMPAGLVRRTVFSDAGVMPQNSMFPPSFYMAMGFGPFGVDHPRTGPMRDIGVPGPQWGMWQVSVSDPDGSSRALNHRPENRKLVRRGSRAGLYRKPADFDHHLRPQVKTHPVEQQDSPAKIKNQSETPVLGPQGYPMYPKPKEDESVFMNDASFEYDGDLNKDDDLMAILHNDYPVFEPSPQLKEEDLDDAAISAELNSLYDPSSRFLKAYLGPNALPPVENELDSLWLVSPPERVLLTLQFQEANAVARHPWAPAEDPTRRNDRANHLLTQWQRPSGTNLLEAIPDDQDVFSPDLHHPSPPCREPTGPDVNGPTCQRPCADQNSVCASRHHLFEPTGPRPVCPPCNTRSVTDTLQGPNRLTSAEILSLRTYACSRCTVAETLTADPKTTIVRGAQHPLTGCLCGTKLLGRPLCSAHRATLASRAVIHAALVREWQIVNFAPDQCMFCKFRGGGIDVPGADVPSVFHCSVCSWVVEDDGQTPTLFPGYEDWVEGRGPGGRVFRANETGPLGGRMPAWGEDVQMVG